MPPFVLFAIVHGYANGSFFVGLLADVAALGLGFRGASIGLVNCFWTSGYLLVHL